MPGSLKTIQDFYRYAITEFNHSNIFYGHGTDSAENEALALIFDLLGLPFENPEMFFPCTLTETERSEILEAICLRTKENIPVPYLTGVAHFAGLSFTINEDVLIPRSPIAELIESQFEPWIDARNVTSILDLCTGSGCIAIACAHAFPNAEVTGSDLSKDALTIANINRTNHALDDQLTLIESDIFDDIPKQSFDIIVSNPPYLASEHMHLLPSEYHHEPSLALDGGKTGLELSHRILKDALEYLSPNGILILEVGEYWEILQEQFPNIPFTWIDFSNGGEGVLIITAQELQAYSKEIAQCLETL